MKKLRFDYCVGNILLLWGMLYASSLASKTTMPTRASLLSLHRPSAMLPGQRPHSRPTIAHSKPTKPSFSSAASHGQLHAPVLLPEHTPQSQTPEQAKQTTEERKKISFQAHVARQQAALADRVEKARRLITRALGGKKSILERVLASTEMRPLVHLLVKSFDSYGNTLLHSAAMHDDVSAATLFLKHHADPNATNFDERTPLYFAHSPEMATILLQFGSSLTHLDESKQTPQEYIHKCLKRAQERFNKSDTSLIQLLAFLDTQTAQ